MATLEEIAAEDFALFIKEKPNSKYFSLADDKREKYRIDYISKFSREIRMLRSQIMETEQIDSKSAGQILFGELKKAHEKGNFFIEPSGNVDRDKFNLIRKMVIRDVKSGKYDSLIQRNQEASKSSQKTFQDTQKVDLNTPEGRKEFLDNLYKGYSECKTMEDKINYIESNYDISLKNMSEKQVERVISKFDTRVEVRKIKDSLDADVIQGKNPELDDDELEQLLEDMAVKRYSRENNKDFNVEKVNNDMMVEFEQNTIEIELLRRELVGLKEDKEEKLKKIENLKMKQEELSSKLSLSEEEKKNVITPEDETRKPISGLKYKQKEQSANKLNGEDDLVELFEDSIENSGEDDLVGLFEDSIENSGEDDLVGLFEYGIQKNGEDKENVGESDLHDKNDIEKKDVIEENPILKFLKNMRNRLTQKKLTEGQVYTQEIKPSFFERAKNALSKLVHRNKETVLALDTAENNRKVQENNPWKVENPEDTIAKGVAQYKIKSKEVKNKDEDKDEIISM